MKKKEEVCVFEKVKGSLINRLDGPQNPVPQTDDVKNGVNVRNRHSSSETKVGIGYKRKKKKNIYTEGVDNGLQRCLLKLT